MINYHRSRASQAVNEQQLLTAWNVGAYVSNKLRTEQWGSKVVTQFAEYLKTNAPEVKGYSRRNIYNMVMFFEEYSSPVFISKASNFLPDYFVQTTTAQLQSTDSKREIPNSAIVQTVSAQLPDPSGERLPQLISLTSFSNHIAILNQCKTSEERLFYILYSHRERLKTRELQRCISNDTYTSLLGSKHNLSKGLLQTYPQAPILLKDTVFVDFLGLPQKHTEKKLRMVILCPEADKTVVEYAMSRSMSPTMVAEYKRQLIPKEKMQTLLQEYCDLAQLDSKWKKN